MPPPFLTGASSRPARDGAIPGAPGGVADGGSALLIGHGGAIELALVACLPDAPHDTWGTPFAHCDGVRLGFTGGHFVSAEFQRASRSPVQAD